MEKYVRKHKLHFKKSGIEDTPKLRRFAAFYELKSLRNAFFDLRYNERGELVDNGGEFDYLVDALAESEYKRETFGKLTKLDPEVRLALTKRRFDAIENGEIKPENLEKAELEIGMLLGSMYPFGLDGSGSSVRNNNDGNGGNDLSHAVRPIKRLRQQDFEHLPPRYLHDEPQRHHDRDVFMDR